MAVCDGVQNWEANVEGCTPLEVTLDRGKILFIYEAKLIETKKEQMEEPIILQVIPRGGNPIEVSYLHPKQCPKQQLELLLGFESFQFFHSSKNGTVHLSGAKMHDEGHAPAQVRESVAPPLSPSDLFTSATTREDFEGSSDNELGPCDGVPIWGAHVEGCTPFDVTLRKGEIFVIYEATLIKTKETKKERMDKPISLKVIPRGGNAIVVSYLHPEQCPKQKLGLSLFESFQFFHSWKNGTVYLLGAIIYHEGFALAQEQECTARSLSRSGLFTSATTMTDCDDEAPCKIVHFLGIDVKCCNPPGVTLRIGEFFVVNEATLIETKKEQMDEPISLQVVQRGGNAFVVSSLHPEQFLKQKLDLLLFESFHFFHSWKNGSVYVKGAVVYNEGLAQELELEYKERRKERPRQFERLNERQELEGVLEEASQKEEASISFNRKFKVTNIL